MDTDTEIMLFRGTIIGTSIALLAAGVIWRLPKLYDDYIVPWLIREAVNDINKPVHRDGSVYVPFRDRRSLDRNLTEALDTLTAAQRAAGLQQLPGPHAPTVERILSLQKIMDPDGRHPLFDGPGFMTQEHQALTAMDRCARSRLWRLYYRFASRCSRHH